jgi:hypothetical protein
MGDSVDRQVVEALCMSNAFGKIKIQGWSNKMFGYKKNAGGAVLCKTSGGSIGQLHLFGSSSSGPYLNNISSTPEDPFVDTKPRVCKGIEVYSRDIGVPTLIVFQIMIWDLYLLRKINVTKDVKLQKYRENMMARVKEIQRCKDPSSTLVLRTVPAMRWGAELVFLFNDELRNISRDMEIGILDYDAMLWGFDRNVSRERTLFRDSMHPRQEFGAKFALHLLKLGDEICKRRLRSAEATGEEEIMSWTS